MTNNNDFKLLNTKCSAYFELLEKSLGTKIVLRNKKDKERFGFYLFMLESICNIKDISDIVELITDTKFNHDIFGIKDDDCGVDAVFIDEENNYINLFNFKFRDEYNEDKIQSPNEVFLSIKFVNLVINRNSKGLKGKIKLMADNIIKKLSSNEIWKLRLYSVSNESRELDVESIEIRELKKQYDLETIPIGLNTVSKYMSIRPKAINAVLHVDRESTLPYVESGLSFLIKLSAADLIRITCNNTEYRNNYSMEDFSKLHNIDMEYSLLFDNVRGLILRSTFNDNLLVTLREEPSKFFMYNNGLTVTASEILPESTNGNTKLKIVINDFQVVNGGQTLRTIHKFNQENEDNITNYLSKCELLIRVFKTSPESNVRNKIAEYTNSQNVISKIDLKSLSSEQIQIEQYLNEHGIIYARKIGDTGGVTPLEKYTHKISMEKFGQILFSIKGYPEKASNQKKQIFDKYYSILFGSPDFDISKSVERVNRYFEVKKEYDSFRKYVGTDQKIFYILYMDTKLDINVKDKIKLLESVIKSYQPKGEKRVSDARKLIQLKFKEKLDTVIEKNKKRKS